jgi:ubiquinone/menaquinone biosynthesis C-methylase UbiE
MDSVRQASNRAKWDRAARSLDLMSRYGPEWRWGPAKQKVFSHMRQGEKILFLALGTGLDIPNFPAGCNITAIDISPKMIEKAQARIKTYPGDLIAHVMDVHDMNFPSNTFDQVFTSCTFCSVPDPVAGLKELMRVLKPAGELHMFEHTGSHIFPFSLMMKIMNPMASRFGPELTRDTVANVQAAGFQLTDVNHVFLDTVKTIHAIKPVAV